MNPNTSAAAKKAFETIAGQVPVAGQLLATIVELFWPTVESGIDDIWKQLQNMNAELNLAVIDISVEDMETGINGVEAGLHTFFTEHSSLFPKASTKDPSSLPDVSELTPDQCQTLGAYVEGVCQDLETTILPQFQAAPPELLIGHLTRLGNLHLMLALLQHHCWEKTGQDVTGLEEEIKEKALLYSVLLRACICRTRYVQVVEKQWYKAAEPGGTVTLDTALPRFQIVQGLGMECASSLDGSNYPNDNKGIINGPDNVLNAVVDNYLVKNPSDGGGMGGSMLFFSGDQNQINDHIDKLTRYAERAVYYYKIDNGIVLDSLLAWEKRAMSYGVDAGQLAGGEQQALQTYQQLYCQDGIPYYLQISGAGAWNDGVLSCPAVADPMNQDPTCTNRLGKWTEVPTASISVTFKMSSEQSSSPRRCAGWVEPKSGNFPDDVYTPDYWGLSWTPGGVDNGTTVNLARDSFESADEYVMTRLYSGILVPAPGPEVYLCDPWPVSDTRCELLITVQRWSPA